MAEDDGGRVGGARSAENSPTSWLWPSSGRWTGSRGRKCRIQTGWWGWSTGTLTGAFKRRKPIKPTTIWSSASAITSRRIPTCVPAKGTIPSFAGPKVLKMQLRETAEQLPRRPTWPQGPAWNSWRRRSARTARTSRLCSTDIQPSTGQTNWLCEVPGWPTWHSRPLGAARTSRADGNGGNAGPNGAKRRLWPTGTTR